MDNLLMVQTDYVRIKYITYTLHHLVFDRHACRQQASEDRPSDPQRLYQVHTDVHHVHVAIGVPLATCRDRRSMLSALP